MLGLFVAEEVGGISIFFFSSRRRHTRYWRDWSSDVCSSDLLAQVLTDIDNADSHYIINFIYDELEDFTVTTAFQNRTIPNAVREVVGFYPMLITMQDSLIFVECTQKTPQKVKIGRAHV